MSIKRFLKYYILTKYIAYIHKKLIKKLKTKKRIKVIFLVIHRSVWKVDSVYKNMLEDDLFDPYILICPHTQLDFSQMISEVQKNYEYFNNNGYKVINSYNDKNNSWIDVETMNPDLIFFTNPWKLTFKKYYKGLFMNYLTCYVPYYHMNSSHDKQNNYNMLFHNLMWKIFLPHQESYDKFLNIGLNKAKNCTVTGYPACESLFTHDLKKEVWKKNNHNKIKIIWAPHHTIESHDGLKLSNFLLYADLFVKLSKENQNKIQWAFKPHPLLKSKLYKDKNWGKNKTDLYYDYWKNSFYAQLEDGEYTDLFVGSDALIHDSGSFSVEYLYCNKNILYLANDIELNLNRFGQEALDVAELAFSKSDICDFVEKQLVCSSSNPKISKFINKNIKPYFNEELPSEKIVKNIKKDLLV